MDAFDKKVFEQIIELEEAHYHLGQIKDEISLDELKSKKVKLPEVREMIIEEMLEYMPEDIRAGYDEWLNKIGGIVEEMLLKFIGNEMCNQEIVQYSLDDGGKGINVLETLFAPYAPYSLVIDHILIACRPRKELIDIAKVKSPDLHFRFCIRDTMELTQKGIDATSTKEGLEAALNCKADTILFLLSLEERDDTLTECCRALVEKKEELLKKSHLPDYHKINHMQPILQGMMEQ